MKFTKVTTALTTELANYPELASVDAGSLAMRIF